MIVHIDGGSRGNPGPAGYGVRFTGADGTVVAEFSEAIGVATNNVAEYRGLLAALRYAIEHGVRRPHGPVGFAAAGLPDARRVPGEEPGTAGAARRGPAPRRAASAACASSTSAARRTRDADRLANEAMDGKK